MRNEWINWTIVQQRNLTNESTNYGTAAKPYERITNHGTTAKPIERIFIYCTTAQPKKRINWTMVQQQSLTSESTELLYNSEA